MLADDVMVALRLRRAAVPPREPTEQEELEAMRERVRRAG
jgi:hypothetical protein